MTQPNGGGPRRAVLESSRQIDANGRFTEEPLVVVPHGLAVNVISYLTESSPPANVPLRVGIRLASQFQACITAAEKIAAMQERQAADAAAMAPLSPAPSAPPAAPPLAPPSAPVTPSPSQSGSDWRPESDAGIGNGSGDAHVSDETVSP